MNDSYRQVMFPQEFDYITGRSNMVLKWPRWSMEDIEKFWSLQWEPKNAQNPKQAPDF